MLRMDLPEEVELHVQPGRLVVHVARHRRSGWAVAARRMRARGHDRFLDESPSTKFDREEWEWRWPLRRSVAARSISFDSIPRSVVKSGRRGRAWSCRPTN